MNHSYVDNWSEEFKIHYDWMVARILATDTVNHKKEYEILSKALFILIMRENRRIKRELEKIK